MATKQTTRYLPYQFSTEELEDMSTTVFNNISSVQDLKIEKKETTKQFSDKIKVLEKQNVEFGHLIQQGFEEREIACNVQFNFPIDGKKTITRLDDHSQWVEDMEAEEYNLENLPLVNTGANYEDE